MGTKIRIDSVMRPRSSSRERNTSASVTVTDVDNTNSYVPFVGCRLSVLALLCSNLATFSFCKVK